MKAVYDHILHCPPFGLTQRVSQRQKAYSKATTWTTSWLSPSYTNILTKAVFSHGWNFGLNYDRKLIQRLISTNVKAFFVWTRNCLSSPRSKGLTFLTPSPQSKGFTFLMPCLARWATFDRWLLNQLSNELCYIILWPLERVLVNTLLLPSQIWQIIGVIRAICLT